MKIKFPLHTKPVKVINFSSKEQFEICTKLLFAKGFVFTTNRIKTFEEMNQLYPEYWKRIIFGRWPSCSRVFYTADSVGNFSNEIDWKTFLQIDY